MSAAFHGGYILLKNAFLINSFSITKKILTLYGPMIRRSSSEPKTHPQATGSRPTDRPVGKQNEL